MKKTLFAAIPIMLLFTGCSLYTQDDFDEIKEECEAKIDDYESDIDEYKDEIDEYKDTIAGYEEEIARLETENADYMESIATVSEENDELMGEISEYEDLQMSDSSDVDAAYEEIAAMAPDDVNEDLFVIAVLIYMDCDNYLSGTCTLEENQEMISSIVIELASSNYNDHEMSIYTALVEVSDLRMEIIDSGAGNSRDDELEYAIMDLFLTFYEE